MLGSGAGRRQGSGHRQALQRAGFCQHRHCCYGRILTLVPSLHGRAPCRPSARIHKGPSTPSPPRGPDLSHVPTLLPPRCLGHWPSLPAHDDVQSPSPASVTGLRAHPDPRLLYTSGATHNSPRGTDQPCPGGIQPPGTTSVPMAHTGPELQHSPEGKGDPEQAPGSSPSLKKNTKTTQNVFAAQLFPTAQEGAPPGSPVPRQPWLQQTPSPGVPAWGWRG